MILVTNDGTITSEENFRALNPLVSFPATLKSSDIESFGMSILTEVPQPESSSFVNVQPGPPTLIDGVWTQTWIQTSVEVAAAKSQLLSNLAGARYTAQVAPITINNVTVDSTVASLTMLKSTIDYMMASDTASINFKASNGWATLTATQLQAFVTAIGSQVQKCFANEYAHTQTINALTSVDDLSKYDLTTGW